MGFWAYIEDSSDETPWWLLVLVAIVFLPITIIIGIIVLICKIVEYWDEGTRWIFYMFWGGPYIFFTYSYGSVFWKIIGIEFTLSTIGFILSVVFWIINPFAWLLICIFISVGLLLVNLPFLIYFKRKVA